MDEKELNLKEAWEHFWANTYKTQTWRNMSNPERDEMRVANRTYKGKVRRKRADGSERVVSLEAERMERLMNKHAPGKYKYREAAFILVK